MSQLNNPHDKLFKETFSHHDVVTDFITHYLPEEILDIIDVTTITPLQNSFINEELQDYYSDLLFSVSISNSTGYLYLLFEHKSYPQKTVAFQLLQYMVTIWEKQVRKKKIETLPIILPIVLYQGKQRWERPNTIVDWFGGYDRINTSLHSFIPQFDILFFDFSIYGQSDMFGSIKLKAYLQLIKNIYNGDIEQIYSTIVQLDQAMEFAYFETAIIYTLHVTEDLSIESLKERLTIEGRKRLMTVADQLRTEGIEQGIEQGKIEGIEKGKEEVALKMLALGKSEQEIMQLTNLSLKRIESLKIKLEQ